MHPDTSLILDLRSEGIVHMTQWSEQLQNNLRKGITMAGKYAERQLKSYFSGRHGSKSGTFTKSYDYQLRVRSGALRASISSIVESGIGGVRARVGPAFKYGMYNEFGARIPVTKKMRAFLGWRYGVWLKKSTTEIILPSRPWFFPTVEKSKPGILQIVRDAIDMPLRK